MSTTIPKPDNATDEVTHSKEDALPDREFVLLLRGARDLEPLDDLLATFAVMATGKLGLRAGELAHLRESWIDWRERRVQVPAHDPCDKGMDGGICGYCRQCAHSSADCHDGLTEREAEAHRWHPKTDAAVRQVPFHWCPRLELAIEDFFDEFDRWPLSRSGVNRRVEWAAEEARHLTPDDVHPHALRATAATRFASWGLDSLMLEGLMGWADADVARRYVKTSPENISKSIDQAALR